MAQVLFGSLRDNDVLRHSLLWSPEALRRSANALVRGCVRPAIISLNPSLIPNTDCRRSSQSQRIACATTSSRVAYLQVANSCSMNGLSSWGSSTSMGTFSIFSSLLRILSWTGVRRQRIFEPPTTNIRPIRVHSSSERGEGRPRR